MENKGNAHFYHNLSRKELQILCKKYKLPANKSQSDLATSLVSYLEDGCGGSLCTHTVFQHEQGTLKNKEHAEKSFVNQSGVARDGKIINMCQYNCEANNVGTSRADENIAHCPNTTREVPPSFEFYVWSDEGIGLSVDLNSSPSDWSNKFKNEVCVSENDYGNNSRSLRQDLRCLGESDKQSKNSFCWNMNAGCVDDYNGETQPSPSSRLVNHDLTVFDQQEKGDTSLMSASVMPCSTTVNVAQNPKEDQSIISAEASYDAPNHSISMDESCARYASREILDSDVISTLLTKSACGYAGNSGSDTGTLEKQTSELKGEVCGNLTLMNSCKFVNPNMVYCGGSASGSVEYQVSEAASCYKDFLVSVCENDIFLGPTDLKHTSETEQSGLVNPSDRNLDCDGNHFLSFGEEWEVDKFINGRESSECSQFDNSVKKTCPSSDGLESRKVHHKNRELMNTEDRSGNGKPAAKNLRTMKNIAGKVIPRRSKRLISK